MYWAAKSKLLWFDGNRQESAQLRSEGHRSGRKTSSAVADVQGTRYYLSHVDSHGTFFKVQVTLVGQLCC